MEKKDKKILVIVFIIAVLIGLSVGIVIGMSLGLRALATIFIEVVEANGLVVNIDINETKAVDYMVELINKTIELK